MQSKLVENWLTSAKEISFTAPFVQLLISEGYTVLQSKGGPTEQGKDIIALSPKGEIHCFQLKCDDIGSTQWQKIRSQLDDLTEIPPKHSTFKNTPNDWTCFLVTNGEISGQTLQTIVDYSSAKTKQGKMALRTTSKDELLKRFSEAFGKFLPIEPNDIRVFFELYCEPGDNVLKREDFKLYFERFFSAIKVKNRQKQREAINASLILASYILTNKYTSENYLAILDAWILLLTTILYYAEKWELDDKEFKLCEELIYSEFESLFEQVVKDISEDQHTLVDSTYGVFSEPFMTYRLRCAELLGYVAACVNFLKLSQRQAPSVTNELKEKIQLIAQNKLLISEATIPYQYNVILSSILNGSTSSTIGETVNLVGNLLMTHEEDAAGLASPYYTVEQVIADILDKEKIDENFQGRSYTLWAAVLLLAKYDQRDYLNSKWREISQICMEEIVAKDANDLLLWRIEDGEQLDSYPAAEKSWSELVNEANENYDDLIPNRLLTRKYLIPLIITAMPHRFSPRLFLSLLND